MSVTSARVACEMAGSGAAGSGDAGSGAAELRLPCLGALRAADIVAAAARGADAIELVAGDCASCERAAAGPGAVSAAGVARDALAAVGRPVEIAWEWLASAREPTAAGRSGAPSDPGLAMSRRALLGAWRRPARRAVSGMLRDSEPAAAMVARQGVAPAWRRRLELDVLALARPGRPGGRLPLELGLGLPVVEGACDGCGLCALVCPLAALSVSGVNLSCRPGACTACGLCVDVCPTRGLALQSLDWRTIVAAGNAVAWMPTAAPPPGAAASAVAPLPAAAVSAGSLAARAGATDRGIRDYARRPVVRTRAAAE